jgi:hypothetical protein
MRVRVDIDVCTQHILLSTPYELGINNKDETHLEGSIPWIYHHIVHEVA